VISAVGYLHPLPGLTLTLAGLLQSGQPVNFVPDAALFGTRDLNGDGASFGEAFVGNSDRYPGVSRNAGRLPWSTTIDLGARYVFPFGARRLEASLDVFNLFDANNESGFANAATTSNQIQFGGGAPFVQRNAAPPAAVPVWRNVETMTVPIALRLQGLLGLAAILALAWLLSERRGALPRWRWIGGALLLQFLLAVVVVRVPWVWEALRWGNEGIRALEAATRVGSSYLFGYLGGGELPFELREGMARPVVIVFDILPLVIVTSAVAALLWHWGLLRAIVRGLSWLTQRALGVGGAVGLSAGANLFLGVVEAPLVVRAYLDRMSRAELFMIMTLGMSTVSGVVLVLYASTLSTVIDNALGHLVAASIVSLPAALLLARMLVPEGAQQRTAGSTADLRFESSLDAIVRGTLDGLQLFLAIIAILLVVFALVALTDQLLAQLPAVGGAALTLQRIFGAVFAPLLWLIGVPWSEAPVAGALMGTKVILNEYVAYQQLAALDPGGARHALAPDHHLRALRFREPREHRPADLDDRRPGAVAPRGDRLARHQVLDRRQPRHGDDRRRDRHRRLLRRGAGARRPPAPADRPAAECRRALARRARYRRQRADARRHAARPGRRRRDRRRAPMRPGLALIVANRLFDGLDGAVARVRGKTDFGGFLDIYADFVFYAAVPAGFAFADPSNALPAALLLASFLLSGISFLGYAVVAERRGLVSTAQGEKTFYYMAGIAEGAETIVVFVLATLQPQWFPQIALAYAALCTLTGFGRLALGWRHFR
jgi:concentrative nucleoside transporter, CNT family